MNVKPKLLIDRDEKSEAFFHRLIMAEEDRRVRCPWTITDKRNFRWFKSPNVVDLVVYRRKRQAAQEA
jgi:hypothetical protein